MNRLSEEKQKMILRALCEGNSIRATARMVGCAKRTVSNLLRDVGAHCRNYHDRFVTGLDSERVQADEIWSFVGCKQKNVDRDSDSEDQGDVWTWTALDQDAKLLIAYRVGNHGYDDALSFITDLRDRLNNRVQLTTDGLTHYTRAVEEAFGWDRVDYAQLKKVYSAEHPGRGRYSPPKCVGTTKRWVTGEPDMDDVTTSHVERHNLSIRMGNRRFTRLTNAFSRKVEYHLYAVALHTMYYNFCKVHGTLTKQNGGIKTTPAMAAGIADRPWDVGDLLDLLQGK